MSPRLVLVPGGGVPARAGRVLLARKFLTGMAELVRGWPGPVTVVARPLAADPSGNLGSGWHDPAALPFEVVLDDDVVASVAARRPAVVHAPLDTGLVGLLAGPAPVVWVLENTPLMKHRYAVIEGAPLASRPRMLAGALRADARLGRAARAAAGLQVNGFGALPWATRWGVEVLPFVDTRLTGAMVAEPRAPGPAGEPLRLGFSGRLVPAKGPEHAVALVGALRRAGLPVRMTVFGDGPLRTALERRRPPGVELVGSLDFESAWVPAVRDTIDVMVLPHPQGDPSGTYLEAAGLGVPVLGYANAQWAPLAAQGLGWAAEVGDLRGLIDLAWRVAHDPDAVGAASAAGRAYMAEHSFEREFARRVAHLRAAAGLR